MISATPITRAMLFAAGLGTRFKPWTDRHPKALALVNGKSLLQRNVEYLQRYGITEVIVNVHHFADQIRQALASANGWGSHIIISDETDEVLETGGGLMKARHWLENAMPAGTFSGNATPGDVFPGEIPLDKVPRSNVPFLVMNVDILTDLDLSALIADHFRRRPLATLAVTNRTTSRYFLFDYQEELCGWRNTKTGEERIARAAGAVSPLEQKAFSGIHVISPDIFPLVRREGKFSMVDVYLDLAAEQTIRGFDHSHSRLMDVGKPESVDQAEKLFP